MRATYITLLGFVVGVMVMGCVSTPAKIIADMGVEKAIRVQLKKPVGELTKEDLTKVTSLYLANTKITYAGLLDLSKLEKLTRLYLHNDTITDSHISEVAKLENLTELNLTSAHVTDKSINELMNLKNLVEINLNYTHVTKEGVARLQKALPKCRIHSHVN